MSDNKQTDAGTSCSLCLFTIDRQWEGRVRSALLENFTIKTIEREVDLYQCIEASPLAYNLIALDVSSLETGIDEVVGRLLDIQPEAKIVAFSPAPSFSQVVAALKSGSIDFHAQTLSKSELRQIFNDLCRRSGLEDRAANQKGRRQDRDRR